MYDGISLKINIAKSKALVVMKDQRGNIVKVKASEIDWKRC